MGFDCIGPWSLDVSRHRLGVEVKHTQGELPKWISATLEQAQQARKFHIDEEVTDHTMPPLEHYDYDPICVFGDAGRQEQDILCILPLVDYVLLRKKAAAWEEDLKDIRGFIKMDCRSDEISLSKWKGIFTYLGEVLYRYLKRGF